MKVVVYTVSYCKFSQEEKEYLKQRGIDFEEKNLETNPVFLEEMLKVSNNFAGTPVTVVVRDDGSQTVIKGFNKEELDQALAFSSAESQTKSNETKNNADLSEEKPLESQVKPATPETETSLPQDKSQQTPQTTTQENVPTQDQQLKDKIAELAGVNSDMKSPQETIQKKPVSENVNPPDPQDTQTQPISSTQPNQPNVEDLLSKLKTTVEASPSDSTEVKTSDKNPSQTLNLPDFKKE